MARIQQFSFCGSDDLLADRGPGLICLGLKYRDYYTLARYLIKAHILEYLWDPTC